MKLKTISLLATAFAVAFGALAPAAGAATIGGFGARPAHFDPSNPLTRSYESNGPDVKIRGTALHIAEKYLQLARDATSAGDRVTAENYLQHAEHYYRILMAQLLRRSISSTRAVTKPARK